MMKTNQTITELIYRRFSCRTYQKKELEKDDLRKLTQILKTCPPGPFGNQARFELLAATPADSKALRWLGTYGFIRNPAGFIVGAASPGEKNLEDFGYQMEKVILQATDLGLGTCWLGGTFTKSKFADQIGLHPHEAIPAATAAGYIHRKPHIVDAEVRRFAKSDHRKPWGMLFFDRAFGLPLNEDSAQNYAVALEMVRLAPSASNRQPWRLVRNAQGWHLYLQRTPGYRKNVITQFLQTEDLQRVDMGIAMSHFELTLKETGISGQWVCTTPEIALPDEHTEYIATWQEI